MYSYDERLKAVELYLKFGKRIGRTIRHLGYPTKHSLKKWHQEFTMRGKLELTCARSKQKYLVKHI